MWEEAIKNNLTEILKGTRGESSSVVCRHFLSRSRRYLYSGRCPLLGAAREIKLILLATHRNEDQRAAPCIRLKTKLRCIWFTREKVHKLTSRRAGEKLDRCQLALWVYAATSIQSIRNIRNDVATTLDVRRGSWKVRVNYARISEPDSGLNRDLYYPVSFPSIRWAQYEWHLLISFTAAVWLNSHHSHRNSWLSGT